MARGEAGFGWKCAQAFVKHWEGEQAQSWRFCTTEIPEFGRGHHRTNFGQIIGAISVLIAENKSGFVVQ